jgi:SNF2 family DNA or RNA helicase
MSIDLSALWPHQYKTFQFGLDRDAVFNTSDAGTGKTLAHAKLAEHFLANGGSRVIVVCPKVLMRNAWGDDLTKFCPELTVAYAEAPAEVREAAFNSKADIVLLNTDGATWLASQPKRWLVNRIGRSSMLICDESHLLKNRNAQRTKALFKLSEHFARRANTSGTPAPNSVTELWAQAKLLDGGTRLGKRFTLFRDLVQRPEFNGFGTNWTDKQEAELIAYGLLSDINIGFSLDEVLPDIPDMDKRVLYYDLPAKHRAVYEQLYEKAMLSVEGKTITAVNAAALATKLLQCASGAVYNDPTGEDKSYSLIDSGRYELIGELIEARPHTVVFYLWHHQRDELIKEMKRRKLTYAFIDSTVRSEKKREEIIKAAQAGEYRALLMHPETGSHGLTLTRATTVVYASPDYSAKRKVQGDARVRRGQQRAKTESIVVVARGTRDEQAYDVFTGKLGRMEALHNLFQKGK